MNIDFIRRFETLVIRSKRLVMTSDDNNDGIHYGWQAKTLTEEQWTDMMTSLEDPGMFILENFPAPGTCAKDRLTYMDDADVVKELNQVKGDDIYGN